MLSKLILSDEVKANYDPIIHFPKMERLSMSLYFQAGTQNFYTSVSIYTVVTSL